MRRLSWIVAAAISLAAGGDTWANDSTYALGAGGLVLTGDVDIRIASEDLFVSRDLVRVRYEFVNESGAPITTRVAYPLPETDLAALTTPDVNWPTDAGDNVVDFQVKVGGRLVTPTLERKAYLDGVDVTDALSRAGAPISPRADEVVEALKRLPASAKDDLAERKLAKFEKGWVWPRWKVKNVYHWEQTFPADKPLYVEHAYKPVVGGAMLQATSYFERPEMLLDEWYGRHCIDKATRSRIAQRLKRLQRDRGDAALMEWRIDYVLSSQRNWKGPIGKFRLTLDKGKADNIISMCWEGSRKTGPRTYLVERRDFQPDSDLRVLIFETPDGR